MLLCHAHIKKALRVTMGKELQSGAVLHGSGDRAELRVLDSLLHQHLAENGGEGLLRRNLRVRHSIRVKGGYTVIVARVHLCRLIALTFFSHNMQKVRARPLIDRAQSALQFLHIMTVHRADVLKAHILEHGGVVHGAAHQRFCAHQRLFHRRTDQWHAVQKAAHIILGIVIGRSRAQMGQIPRQRTNIFRDGHLVIVQDHKQIIQPADVVHALVYHTASKSTIADHCHHKPGFSLDFFCPSHANGQRKRRIAMSGNKGIVHTFMGVRETGNTIQLPQMVKLLPASGEQLVSVALMPHVEYNLILRRFQYTVQRHCKLYGAKIRGQMPARFGDVFQHKMPYLRAKLLHLLCIQLFKIAGLINLVQQQRFHIHTSFMRLYFGRFCRFLHDREQKAHQRAEQHACYDLQRRVTDHFLQVHILQKGSIFLAYIDPLGDHLVQHLCLLAGLVPDTHSIMHGDDRYNAGNRENGRRDPGTAPGNNGHGADGRAVCAGHTAIAPHPL